MASKHQAMDEVSRAVARIQAGILAVVGGLIGGAGLFGMTAWLLLKGGPNVGAHLQLLSNYFIGYSVSWKGSLVGLCYGAMLGAMIGWTIGNLYNWIVRWRQPERR
jgi:hypothetical protein